ncbi:MAG: murein L,D-transpeptidase catalytic domain family protein [Thermoanaerobaculia bacterium]
MADVPEAVVEAVPTAPATAPVQIQAEGLAPEVLAAALEAMSAARARGVSAREDLLTVIDYSLPSTEPRLWVLDLARHEVLFRELVAHGKGTGEKYATRFSNAPESRQTSLGLFLTRGTYVGGNGYSLRLQGLDAGLNDRAEARAIVMHGAWYVSSEQARAQGRIGRSWGCPAVSEKVARPVIDTIKGGSFIFSYHSQLAEPGGAASPATARAAR